MKLTSEKREKIVSKEKVAGIIWYIVLFISIVLLAGTISKEISSGRPIIRNPDPFENQPDPKPSGLFQNSSRIDTLSLKATAYTASTTECDPNPNETAFGTETFLGGVTVSQDLHRSGWTQGKIIKVHGMGYYVINDLMPKKHKRKIDILMTNKKETSTFGIQTVTVSLLNTKSQEP